MLRGLLGRLHILSKDDFANPMRVLMQNQNHGLNTKERSHNELCMHLHGLALDDTFQMLEVLTPGSSQNFDDVMFQIAAMPMSFQLCTVTVGNSTHSCNVHVVFVLATSFFSFHFAM